MCNRVDRLVKIVAEYKRELPKYTCRIESLEGNMQIVELIRTLKAALVVGRRTIWNH